jgi:hypothetical protein
MNRSASDIVVLAAFTVAMLIIPAEGRARAVEGNSDVDEAALQSCAEYGTGYFRLPNSETCLKIGGQITVTGEAGSVMNSVYLARPMRVSATLTR